MSNSTGYSFHQAHEAHRIPLVQRLYDYVSAPFQRIAAVNELEQLSDRQLRDIGVDRRQIEQVAAREFEKLRSRL